MCSMLAQQFRHIFISYCNSVVQGSFAGFIRGVYIGQISQKQLCHVPMVKKRRRMQRGVAKGCP